MRTIIFAKAPKPGLAKTRLIPALGADGAANLARWMLNATISGALAARLGPVELCVTPAIGSPDWSGVETPQEIEITDQAEGDIGRKMAAAARRALSDCPAILLVGTDWAEIAAARLREAAGALLATGAVLYPSVDGGYVLLGLTRYSAELFDDIAWSTDKVAGATMARFEALGWPCHQGPLQHDVDEPEDLAWLAPRWRPAGGC